MKLTDLTADRLDDLVERLWSKVQIGDVDDCWPWTGTLSKKYGIIKIPRMRRNMLAHRIVFELFFGPLENEACHHCDNPPCCNPFHLFDGTQAENVADMITKGRKAIQRHEEHPQAKLDWIKVAEIRGLYATGSYGQRQLARMFKVDHAIVCRILHGQRWVQPA